MTDEALRRLELALAGGDATARDPLARGYLRAGRPSAALDMGGLSPALEQEAWVTLLAGFRLAHRFEGAAPGRRLGLDANRLVGWFGPDHAFAALYCGSILDTRRGTWHRPGEDNFLGAEATSDEALFCRYSGLEIIAMRPDEAGGWKSLRQGHLPPRRHIHHVLASPDGDAFLLRDQGGEILIAGADLVQVAGVGLPAGAHAVDWEARRISWFDRQLGWVLSSPLAQRLPQQLVSLEREPDILEVVGRAEPGRARPLLIAPPWLLLEDAGSHWTVRSLSVEDEPQATGELRGPVRLGLDGRSLLAFRGRALPVRLPLSQPHPLPGFTAPSQGERLNRSHDVWHPRAEVAAAAQGSVVTVGGSVLFALGDKVLPLGWSPDGRSLLALRPPDVELWSAPG